jgi:hypothetical protein
MMRRLIGLACGLGLVAGCSESHAPQMSMEEMMKKPTPAPELAKLNPLVGDWTGTAEMIEPTVEEMKKHMPPGSKEPMSNTFKGGARWEWSMGGLVLKSEGWHEMGEGQRANMVEYMGWDPKTRKYWTYYMDDWGNHGHGTITLGADGKTLTFDATGTDGRGYPTKGHGTMTIVDNNTITWAWQQHGAMGTMKMRGTSKRM